MSSSVSPAASAPAASSPDSASGIDAVSFGAVVVAFRDALRVNQAALNRLNVYPVPDGDTGTNMALTMESVATAIDGLADADRNDMAAVTKAVTHGSLMGARGNSGVILSQILKGLSAGFREHAKVGGRELASALTRASEAAYQAVMRPTEGTILTVVRRAAEGAIEAARGNNDLVTVAEAARTTAGEALAETPDLLPALKAAGVVDAGGAGLLLLLDAVLGHFTGRAIPRVETPDGATLADDDPHGHAHGERPKSALEELRYEVMYFLEAADESIPGFKDVWASIGDSIVVSGGEGLWNCHIHTDDIGAAIEAAVQIGRPSQIRVTDLLDQLEEVRWVREASEQSLVAEPPHVDVPCETAVVAVATGDGIRRLFWSLGVQRVVTGGQTMNPSTQQLLDAVEACPAQSVVILPNNKNIIAVAEQVDALTSKSVEVVRTRGVSEGLAAAVQYDPEGAVGTNAAAMSAAAATVVSGEITRAVRDSVCDLGPIAEGDFIGLNRDEGIVAVAPTLAEAAVQLLDQLITDHHEIVTIIEGDGSTAAVTRHITEWLSDNRVGTTAELHQGGQPLYPYLFGVE